MIAAARPSRLLRRRGGGPAGLGLGLALMVSLSAPPPANGAPRENAAAEVIALDHAWEAAEREGDAAFLQRLLLPEYRSVTAAGKVSDANHLIEGARKRGPSPALATAVTAWKASHPVEPQVLIAGDTAILSWVSTRPDIAGWVSSVDVFVRREGRWRAIFSQHSAASN